MIERQELYCHECGNYVQFDLDLSLNGNHILRCPCCGHEHCRVVKDGKITDERWGSHNGGNITISSSSTSYTSGSTYNANQYSSLFIYSAWMNTVSTGTTGTW